MRTSLFTQTLLACGILLGTTLVPAQGPLDPPGAPEATMKSLDQIEARIPANTLPGSDTAIIVISQPGSYYLTADVTGEEAKNGILIQSFDVSLDLNGFSVKGVTGSLDGIKTDPGVEGVKVTNGHVSGWGLNGINLGGHSTVDGVNAFSNGYTGISAFGQSRIVNCSAKSNGSAGIDLASGEIMDCIAQSNGYHGIDASSAIILRFQSNGNTASGINTGGSPGVISDCTVSGNSANGISANAGGSYIIQNNSTTYNAYHGIDVCYGNRIIGNICYNNGSSASVTGAGINVRCGDNYIEGNQLISNEVGVSLSASAGHVVVKNIFSDNDNNVTNSATNQVAPITTVQLATNPWSNILN